MKIVIATTMQHECSENCGWGVESVCWNLTKSLNDLGHEVILFAKEGSDTPKIGKLIICKNELEVLNYTEELKNCNIVHDWSGEKRIHDYCQEYEIKSLATNFNVHFLFPKYHKNIVCVSDIQKYLGKSGKSGFENTPWQELVGYTGHLRSGKRVYCGIDIEKYKPQSTKENFILYFNSFDYRKGITVALDLAKVNPNIQFKFVGEVSGHFEHQNTFNELKPIMDSMLNVSYEIDVSNERKIELMQKAKAMLFPSLFQQPFALVAVESLACGTPVITTNQGCMPEIITHGITGFLCNSAQEMNKYIQYMNNIDINSSIILNDCRESIEKQFTKEIMAIEYEKLYKEILEGKEW